MLNLTSCIADTRLARIIARLFPVSCVCAVAIALYGATANASEDSAVGTRQSAPTFCRDDQSSLDARDISTALIESKAFSFPFSYMPRCQHYIILKVSINGSAPMPFIFTSAYGPSITIFQSAVGALHLHYTDGPATGPLPPDAVAHVTEAFTALFSAKKGGNVLRFAAEAGAPIINPSPDITNEPGPSIAGSLGSYNFSFGTIRIDFDKQLFTLFTQPNPPLVDLKAVGLISVPLEKSVDDSPLEKWVKVNLGSGNPTLMLLDTSSETTQITEDIAANLSPIDTVESIFSDDAGSRNVKNLLLSHVSIGGTQIPIAEVCVDPQNKIPRLGMDVLSQFNVIVDSRNGFLTLLPRIHRPETMRGDLGITEIPQEGKWFVTTVPPDSPGAKAGLLPGDHLVSADGVTLDSLPWSNFDDSVNGCAWTTVSLLVERPSLDGKTKQLSLTAQRGALFPRLRHSASGFTLLKPDHVSAQVLKVEANSAAEAVGLAAGDSLIAIDGADTAAMSAEVLGNKLSAHVSGAMDLTIKRADMSVAHLLITVPNTAKSPN